MDQLESHLHWGSDINARREFRPSEIGMTEHFGEMGEDFGRIFEDMCRDPSADHRTTVTPLHCAILGGKWDSFETLLENGARIDVPVRLSYLFDEIPDTPPASLDPNDYGSGWPAGGARETKNQPKKVRWTEEIGTLSFALLRGSDERFALAVLHRTETIDSSKSKYWSPLHYAAIHNWSELAEEMIRKGADVNSTNSFMSNHTPLHHAAAAGNLEIVEILLDAGANVNAEASMFLSFESETPLDVAKEKGHTRVSELLRRNGGRSAKR